MITETRVLGTIEGDAEDAKSYQVYQSGEIRINMPESLRMVYDVLRFMDKEDACKVLRAVEILLDL